MRLSQFILENLESILVRWEAFAKSLPPGVRMTQTALRDDAARMLRFVAADIETGQSAGEQTAKSEGHGPGLPEGEESAAHDHGLQRLTDGFNLDQMVSEYRVLRASVTQLWLESGQLESSGGIADAMQQLIRFNESIDQIIAESVTRFNGKLDRDKDMLMAILGHDLRNPLTAIQMCAEALIRSHPSPIEHDLGTRIARSGKRMQVMINDLLDLTRVRLGGRLAVTREACDLNEICRHVVDELRQAHPGRSLTLNAPGKCIGEWDAGRIGQLISNLVGNALQHGGKESPVTVSTTADADAVTLSVHNEGPAIARERQEWIFDPLRRGEKDREEYGGSLGLGLYISREIAQAHDGSIDVTSDQEHGTTFAVRLPRHPTLAIS